MDNELVLFSLKDREKPEVDKLFTQLKTSNDVLYRFLISELQKDSLLEIRKDILDYIAENAANFFISSDCFSIEYNFCTLISFSKHFFIISK